MQACDRCHARKTRCDRRIPQCSACDKARVPCLHADKLRQRNIPRGYIDSLEKTVQELREENERLRRELHRSHQRESNAAISVPESNPRDLSTSPFDGDLSPITQTDSDGGISTPSTRSHVDNAFALEVGYLSLTATGETRYLGSSSGMGLANIISGAIRAQSGTSYSMEPPVSDGLNKDAIHLVPSDDSFPTFAIANPFIQAYFQHTHVTFPLLHRPSFLATVERIYNEPGFYETNTYDAFVFDMVLAIGSSNINRFEEASSAASKFYAMAQSKLAVVVGLDGLSVLRAILLISQHGIFNYLRDASASIWHLVGVGARLCFELGLHLEHGQLNGGPRQPKREAKLTSLDEEMRKRCFWCLYNLDRVVSFTLGRPLAIRDEEIDVALPSHLDDDKLTSTCPIPDSPASASSPFLHVIRIRRISGQILSTFYNSRTQAQAFSKNKDARRRQLHEELVNWQRDTKSFCFSRMTAEQAHVSSFQTEEWYEAVYNNAMLLLYRPSPCFPHPAISSGPHGEHGELFKLLNAAKASILSYVVLHQRRSLNYSWITLHGVFIAGLAYIYSVGRILRDTTQRDLLPDIMSLVEVTRGCSNVLVAISERWSVSRRSSELFNNLSNAVIKDCLHTACKPPEDIRLLCVGNSDGGIQVSQLGQQELNDSTPQARNASADGTSDGEVPNAMSQLDDFLVIDEFKHYSLFFDLVNQTEGSFPSELVAGFSQDWPFETPFNAQDTFDEPMNDSAAPDEIEAMAYSWKGNFST